MRTATRSALKTVYLRSPTWKLLKEAAHVEDRTMLAVLERAVRCYLALSEKDRESLLSKARGDRE